MFVFVFLVCVVCWFGAGCGPSGHEVWHEKIGVDVFPCVSASRYCVAAHRETVVVRRETVVAHRETVVVHQETVVVRGKSRQLALVTFHSWGSSFWSARSFLFKMRPSFGDACVFFLQVLLKIFPVPLGARRRP